MYPRRPIADPIAIRRMSAFDRPRQALRVSRCRVSRVGSRYIVGVALGTRRGAGGGVSGRVVAGRAL